MLEQKGVDVVRFARDAKVSLAYAMKSLNDWRLQYFVDEMALLQHFVNLTREQVLEVARTFSCGPSYFSDALIGEIQVKQLLRKRWKEQFLQDLAAEKSPDIVGKMIGEAISAMEDDVELAAIAKWISLSRKLMEDALTLEDFCKACRLPIGVYTNSDPVIEDAFKRWQFLCDERMKTITSLEGLVVFWKMCPGDFSESVERLRVTIFYKTLNACTSLKKVMELRKFASGGWEDHAVTQKAAEFALKRLALANTRKKLLLMMKRRVYREIIPNEMFHKLATWPD